MAAPENFLLPEGAAAKIFPGKFPDAMRAAGLEKQFKEADAKAWFGNWTVDVQAVGDGRAVLKYLAPYVNRIAISNKRIVDVDKQSVTYRYTPSGTRKSLTRTVTGNEFVRGFLQHTLPPKFQRIRYYGWASPNCRLKFQWVQRLVYFYLGWCWLMKRKVPIEAPTRPPVRCNRCGSRMHLTEITDANGRVVYQRPLVQRSLPQHALPYLDSG